jgi:hypothetical protein
MSAGKKIKQDNVTESELGREGSLLAWVVSEDTEELTLNCEVHDEEQSAM